jgi:hypothetical protein
MGNAKGWKGRKRGVIVSFLFILFVLNNHRGKLDPTVKENKLRTAKDESNYDMLARGVCPTMIQKARGIYRGGGETNANLQDAILVTAANSQFRAFYDNWLLSFHNYSHVLLALDNGFNSTTMIEDNIIQLPSSLQISNAGGFRSPSYNVLVAHKIRAVYWILKACQVSVVFSDVDNIFLKDPLQHDLGHMMTHHQYDYIYQVNQEWTPQPRMHSCLNGTAVQEGNTGFHVMRPSAAVLQLLERTLAACDAPDNVLDDQTNLWNILREEVNQRTWKHCNYVLEEHIDSNITSSNKDSPQLCCLDPHYYTVAQSHATRDRRAPWISHPNDLVTFHANFVGRGGTKQKLFKVNGWVEGGWKLGNVFDYVQALG